MCVDGGARVQVHGVALCGASLCRISTQLPLLVFFLSSAQSRSTPHPKLPVSHGVMSLVLRQSLENLQKTWGSRKQISPKASLERTATLAMTPGGDKNSHGQPAPVHRNSEIGNACRSLFLKLQESVEP